MIIHRDIEQGSDAWHQLRAGMPTASEFSKLITSKGEPSKPMPEYAVQLAVDLYAGEPLDRWQGNQWTDRGNEFEDRARAYYENNRPYADVVQVGFITDDAQTMGMSPDSVIDGGVGLLEIKCLKATEHAKVLMYFDKHERMPTKYVQQTQGQMMIGEAQWDDLLFYHPDLPSLIIRSEPDFKIQGPLRKQIELCIQERDRVISIISEF